MSLEIHGTPEVFTYRDIARAAGADPAAVRALVETGDLETVNGKYVPFDAAVALVNALRQSDANPARRRLFAPPPRRLRLPAMPAAASGAFHGGLLVALILLSGLGVGTVAEHRDPEPVRLVFLATPGPGGGGGGGGLRQPAPPPRAQLKGESKLKSPVSLTRKVERPEPVPPKRTETPPPPVPVVEPKPEPKPEPPPPPPSPTPPVVAPVVSAPADTQDRPGVATETPVVSQSQGPGAGGGSGTGRGTGMGEGNGAGIGDGSIAGTGGGPYRPGVGDYAAVTPARGQAGLYRRRQASRHSG
jgi:hypothetical protein